METHAELARKDQVDAEFASIRLAIGMMSSGASSETSYSGVISWVNISLMKMTRLISPKTVLGIHSCRLSFVRATSQNQKTYDNASKAIHSGVGTKTRMGRIFMRFALSVEQ